MDWVKIRDVSSRPLVVVLGGCKYYDRKIKGWWSEKTEEKFVEGNSLELINENKNIILRECPKLDVPYLFSTWFAKKHLLIFVSNLDDTQIKWLKRRSSKSSKIGFIFLGVINKFDKRKIKWVHEIAKFYGLSGLEYRVSYNLMDRVDWDLGKAEKEVQKFSLFSEDKILDLNFLDRVCSYKLDFYNFLSKNTIERYFEFLYIVYPYAKDVERLKLLRNHFYLCNQMRMSLVASFEPNKIEVDITKIRKVSKFNMSYRRAKAFLEQHKYDKRSALLFLEKSIEWLKEVENGYTRISETT